MLVAVLVPTNSPQTLSPVRRTTQAITAAQGSSLKLHELLGTDSNSSSTALLLAASVDDLSVSDVGQPVVQGNTVSTLVLRS